MADELDKLRSQVSGNHSRVISVRMRSLEETCLRLLDLFRPIESTLTTRPALPKEKAEQVESLITELRSIIGRVKTELDLERDRRDPGREAGALVALMTVLTEELHPHYLKGYGRVPEGLALYLDSRINEVLSVLQRINRALGKPVSEVVPEG